MGIKLAAASGGSIELVPTNTASNFTVTVPATTAAMAIDGPAFSAYQNASISVANGTFVKLSINTEDFDTNSNFDSATNYRFTPTVAGYYQVNGCMNYMTGTGGGNTFVSVYKNGAENRRGSAGTVASQISSNVSCLVYLNGSTDYIELYVFQASGITQTYNPGTSLTYFQASMVRGA